jgi:hypothetical protein
MTRPRSAAHADLDLLLEAVCDLRELAADPERAESPAVRYDFSIRWGVLLAGRLHRLEHYERAGQLEPDERERFEELLDELRAAGPIAERLGLARPSLAARSGVHHETVARKSPTRPFQASGSSK